MIRVWREFIHQGYLISVGDLSAIFALSVILRINITWDFLLVIFLMIFSLLSFNYYREINQDLLTNPKRAEITKRRLEILPYTVFFTMCFALWLVFHFSSIRAVIFLLCLLLGGLLYTIRLKSLTSRILGFKSYYVSFFYPMVLVFLSIYYKTPFSEQLLLIWIFYSSRIFVNTVFCDIRDIEADKNDGLKTFAVVWGDKKTILFLSIINILTVTPIVIGAIGDQLPPASLFICITIFYTCFNLFIYGKRMISDATLFNVMVEGEFIFWLPIVLLGELMLS